MFREALWTLRQRRYARLAALMVVIAGICIAAGTWQIQRYRQSVHDNNALKHNAHAVAMALSSTLVPMVGVGPAPGRDAIRYRTVTTSGTYLVGHEQFVRGASQGSSEGYLVLEPFRTSSGVLMVVRGFVAGVSSAGNPASVTSPPTGPVRITGRLQTASSEDDRAGTLSHSEVRSVNPTEQAARLGEPVYNAYLTLTAGQPGTSGVAVLPRPNLSNPAGGAYEAQHFAYIIQWYLFALLALAAPFAMSRSETREAQRRFLGLEPGTRDFDRALAASSDGVGPERLGLAAGTDAARALAVRDRGAVARADGPSPRRWQRGNRLADRYGRSFGVRADKLAPEGAEPDERDPQPVERAAGHAIAEREPVLRSDRPSSAGQPYRSPDGYHGSYNDYLWELAMADGDLPNGDLPAGDRDGGDRDGGDRGAGDGDGGDRDGGDRDGGDGDGGDRDGGAGHRPLTVARIQPDGRAVITSRDESDPLVTPPADPGR